MFHSPERDERHGLEALLLKQSEVWRSLGTPGNHGSEVYEFPKHQCSSLTVIEMP
jgi:hypothetical protein